MQHKAARSVLLAQISLFAAAAICYALVPQYLGKGGGASNYGVHRETIAFYSLGLIGCGLCLAMAARSLLSATPTATALARALRTLAILFILVLLSTYPYKLSATLDLLHMAVTILLFVYEISLGIWLVSRLSRNIPSSLLLAGQLTGSLFALLSLLGKVHLLFPAEAVAALFFGGLLVRVTAQAESSA